MGSEDEYRKKAEDCLRYAEQSADSALKAIWLRLAESWRKLARRVESRSHKEGS